MTLERFLQQGLQLQLLSAVDENKKYLFWYLVKNSSCTGFGFTKAIAGFNLTGEDTDQA